VGADDDKGDEDNEECINDDFSEWSPSILSWFSRSRLSSPSV